MDSKFLERFNTLQSSPTAKSTCVCKIASTRKSTRPNIDDTDTEDESDDNNTGISPANAWQDEWKSYINPIEDIPIGMGLVRWWGVCVTSCSSVSHCQRVTNADTLPHRHMGPDIQHGVRWLATTSR
jgi:hypothetical protein